MLDGQPRCLARFCDQVTLEPVALVFGEGRNHNLVGGVILDRVLNRGQRVAIHHLADYLEAGAAQLANGLLDAFSRLFQVVGTTRATDRVGSNALWALVGFLLVIYFANVFGTPPPSVTALAWVAQAQWLLVIWAYWIDRHRRADERTDPRQLSSVR